MHSNNPLDCHSSCSEMLRATGDTDRVFDIGHWDVHMLRVCGNNDVLVETCVLYHYYFFLLYCYHLFLVFHWGFDRTVDWGTAVGIAAGWKMVVVAFGAVVPGRKAI